MYNECYCSSSAYWHPSPFLYYLLGHIYKCLGSDAYQHPPRLASLADTYKCRHGSSAANWSNSQLCQACSPEGALVVRKHERGLEVVGEGDHLLITKHILEEREDTLAPRRVWRECSARS